MYIIQYKPTKRTFSTYKTAYTDAHKTYNCIYNHLPEDEPSGSEHVEDIKKLKIEIFRKGAFCWFILYITMHSAKNIKFTYVHYHGMEILSPICKA
jgi:superfamily I DNA/RNA helicase